MRYHIILTGLLLFVSCAGLAQVTAVGDSTAGIVQDARVDELVGKHIMINQNLKTIDGFRIQVYSDSGNNSKTRAQQMKEELDSRYPGLEVYISFKSPNYKVRVGDFRTRLDAQRFLSDMAADYPNAFIITDQINLPKTDYQNPGL